MHFKPILAILAMTTAINAAAIPGNGERDGLVQSMDPNMERFLSFIELLKEVGRATNYGADDPANLMMKDEGNESDKMKRTMLG
jgi:hypothetical protein